MTLRINFRLVFYLAVLGALALIVFNKHCDGTYWWPV